MKFLSNNAYLIQIYICISFTGGKIQSYKRKIKILSNNAYLAKVSESINFAGVKYKSSITYKDFI